MATPGLWGYGGNQTPGIFDYGLHAIKDGGKDIIKNGLGLVEGTTLVLSNGSGNQPGRELSGRETLRDISLKGADWLKQDTSSEGTSKAEAGTLAPNNGIMFKNTDLLLRANGFLPGQAEVVDLASDASRAKNTELTPGFKQVVRSAIASSILPNPATMQSDYKFIEGGLSTPILKLASVTGGFMMDKKGNVYLIADGSVGYGLGLPIPVTGSVGQGYFGNAEKSDEADYREALAGGSFGTTTGAGVQGNVSIGTSGVLSGELSLNPSVAKTFGGRYAWYLFNIYD
ncbi:hypothetical protein [Anaerospora hongkongensis]|uniref:hypothetical protein n=1 Tax=Anaerospora hongkongensis TaxID=244830 RepID=UPI00289F6B4A|nr:hypothetical protein [Anaerospora hongkongensis]